MAITRRLDNIIVTFDSQGNPTVVGTGVISDDSEGTQVGKAQAFGQNAVVTAATQLRDAVLTVAQNAGKPLTF
jgi:hypothetical protein